MKIMCGVSRIVVTKIVFEINSFNFPGSGSKVYQRAGRAVWNQLYESDFNKNININCPFREEVQKIVASTEEKQGADKRHP